MQRRPFLSTREVPRRETRGAGVRFIECMEHVVDAYTNAWELLYAGEEDAAQAAFATLVAQMPTAFDAWIGVHYLDRGSPRQALESMIACADEAGALQEAAGRQLASGWHVTPHLERALVTGDDARLALAVMHLEAGDLSAAQLQCALARGAEVPTRALVEARIHLARHDSEAALLACGQAMGDPDCALEAERYRGYALAEAGCAYAAIAHLRLAAERSPHLGARLEARYHEASVCADQGDAAGERQALELIYAEAPLYGDVAERLFPDRADQLAWQRLVRQLETMPSSE